MYEAYRVRRKFQWNIFVYAPPGPCACSSAVGSALRADRAVSDASGASSVVPDGNPCADKAVCNGLTASGCNCNDSGYCTCGIKPWMYGGDIWLVQEGDPRKEHVLLRRFAIYDPTLPSPDTLLQQERYKVLVHGEPTPDKVWFPPNGTNATSVQARKE